MALIVILGAALALAGCSHDEPSRKGRDPFTVAISADAARASRKASVDLERLAARSARRAFDLLPHRGRVRIEIVLDAACSIPEIGVGGLTNPETGDVFVSIDGTLPGGLKAALETWVPALLAHELHHSSRIRMGPGYGITLAEALVTEGLADHFVAEAFPDTRPQPWDHALSGEQEAELWQKAQPILEVRGGYNHQAWFFGGGDLPRWAGYTLGYRIAQAYLGDDFSASSAVGTEADTVIERYVSTPRNGRASPPFGMTITQARPRSKPPPASSLSLTAEKHISARSVVFRRERVPPLSDPGPSLESRHVRKEPVNWAVPVLPLERCEARGP